MRAARFFLAVMLIPLFSVSGSALAQQKIPAEIEISPGYGGFHLIGAWLPVTVQVTSSRAISGTLEIESQRVADFGGGRTSQPRVMEVEIAAGGRKQFEFLIPPLANPDAALVARLVTKQGRAGKGARVAPAGDAMLVGILGNHRPEALEGSALRAVPTAQLIRSVDLPTDRLRLGMKALDPLSYVAGDALFLQDLSDRSRDSLIDWVTSGGRLIVFAREESQIGWIPGDTGIVWSAAAPTGRRNLAGAAGAIHGWGAGEFVVIPGSLQQHSSSSALWQSAVRPVPVVAGATQSGDFGGGFENLEILNQLTGEQASDSIRMEWLVFFLIAYVALIGPFNYSFLRARGRKELGWITIPALAVVFSAAALVVSRRGGPDPGVQEAALVFAAAEGESGVRTVALRNNSRGETSIEFDTYQISPANTESTNSYTRLLSDTAEAVVRTAPFSVAAAAGGIEEFPGHIESSAIWETNAFRVKVTNRTQSPLENVVAVVGEGAVGRLDRLAPGATGELRVSDTPGNLGSQRVQDLVGLADGDSPFLTRALLADLRDVLRSKGTVGVPFVVASMRDVPRLNIDGKRVKPKGMTLLLSPMSVSMPPGFKGRIPLAGVRSEVISTEGGIQAMEDRSDPHALNGGFGKTVTLFTLPWGVDPRSVTSVRFKGEIQGNGIRVEAWDWSSQKWVALRADPGAYDVELPVGSISESGETYVGFAPINQPPAMSWGLEVTI